MRSSKTRDPVVTGMGYSQAGARLPTTGRQRTKWKYEGCPGLFVSFSGGVRCGCEAAKPVPPRPGDCSSHRSPLTGHRHAFHPSAADSPPSPTTSQSPSPPFPDTIILPSLATTSDTYPSYSITTPVTVVLPSHPPPQQSPSPPFRDTIILPSLATTSDTYPSYSITTLVTAIVSSHPPPQQSPRHLLPLQTLAYSPP
ncbi:hypothetical protein J6590_019794 [Homalodisca vitripennis]|nr:hypothetical protein J6590_019794 [Homalodisca vitripennis]